MFLSRVLQRLPPSGVEIRLREPDPVLLALIRRYRRILQFATVGVSGVLVNMASVWAGLQLVQAADPDLRDALASSGAAPSSGRLLVDWARSTCGRKRWCWAVS